MTYSGIKIVNGQPYHQVVPEDGSHWTDMIMWCVETFGPSGTPENPGIWSIDERWYVNNSKFLFQEELDRDLFLLRWS